MPQPLDSPSAADQPDVLRAEPSREDGASRYVQQSAAPRRVVGQVLAPEAPNRRKSRRQAGKGGMGSPGVANTSSVMALMLLFPYRKGTMSLSGAP
jgi:hypothetical protein